MERGIIFLKIEHMVLAKGRTITVKLIPISLLSLERIGLLVVPVKVTHRLLGFVRTQSWAVKNLSQRFWNRLLCLSENSDELSGHFDVFHGKERDGDPRLTCSACSTNSMHIILDLSWKVKINH